MAKSKNLYLKGRKIQSQASFNTFSLLTLSIRDTISIITMNLLKSTLLASLVAAAANAQEEEPSIPNLTGQNFKITVRKYMQKHTFNITS